MSEGLTRGAIAGSVLALSLAGGGCTFGDPEAQAHTRPANADIPPTRSFEPTQGFEYGAADYDAFNATMRAGRLGLRAYFKASRAVRAKSTDRQAAFEHLHVGKSSQFKTDQGGGEISFAPLSIDGGTSLVVARDGGNFTYDTHMSVRFDNPTPKFFGQTVEKVDIQAFFADPTTHVSEAVYRNRTGRTAPCEWQAELTPSQANVATDSQYCLPPPTNLGHLATFSDEVFY